MSSDRRQAVFDFFSRFVLRTCVRCGSQGSTPLCDACAARPLVKQLTGGQIGVRALGQYNEPLGQHLRALKYEETTAWARLIGRALAQKVGGTPLPCLVPVPLHPIRLAERGFNQSALLARSLAQASRSEVEFSILERTKPTAAQARLNAQERAHNLDNAFRAQSGAAGKRVFLVDDVVTTGSTLDSCAAALRAEGIIVLGAMAGAIAEPPPRDSRLKNRPTKRQ